MSAHQLLRRATLLLALIASLGLVVAATAGARGSAVTQSSATETAACPPGDFYEGNWHPGLAHIFVEDTKSGHWACVVKVGTKLSFRYGAFSTANDYFVRINISPVAGRCVPSGNGASVCSAPDELKNDIVWGHNRGTSATLSWTAKRGRYDVCVVSQAGVGEIGLCQSLTVR
jgi:hypothetical protein